MDNRDDCYLSRGSEYGRISPKTFAASLRVLGKERARQVIFR